MSLQYGPPPVPDPEMEPVTRRSWELGCAISLIEGLLRGGAGEPDARRLAQEFLLEVSR